ncbi:MAG: transglycosylase SLT domain-containing protein [Ghiorsea sp.]
MNIIMNHIPNRPILKRPVASMPFVFTCVLALFISSCTTSVGKSTHVTIEKDTYAEIDSANHNLALTTTTNNLIPEEELISLEPVDQEPSEFLAELSESDILLIKKEATRTVSKSWDNIDSRSMTVRYRMLQVLEDMNAPVELLFIPVAESGYNPYALSPAGAFGLWQLMPKTAIELGAHHRNGIDGRRHVESSTKAAISYLQRLHDRFDSWPLAICAYNLGPWGVERRLRKNPWTPDQGLNNLPFPAETRHYVKQILGMIALAEDNKLAFSEPVQTVDIQINAPIDLKQMESTSGLEKNELFRLNPALDFQNYIHRDLTLHLPAENAAEFERALLDNPDIFKPKFIRIKIKSGDSLWTIARRHHTTIRHLKKLNPKLKRTLSIGKHILVPAKGSITTASSKPNPLLSTGRRIRYKVRNGDSLWKIAKKFGTSTRAIARANQMLEKRLIRPGDRIWVIARFQPS